MKHHYATKDAGQGFSTEPQMAPPFSTVAHPSHSHIADQDVRWW